ncbi:YppG-like protein [Lentibacillus halodurans]|uniref:YppG-like protein n=1 Tax=Lentibacillus halodurans TaxID=237679 RepID=A0A1I0WBJ9_9BACI|nr:YppG family protein [Lentibacillus halodurans]SFA85276.1 YppG-like protein [Lentibacillus halodurans]
MIYLGRPRRPMPPHPPVRQPGPPMRGRQQQTPGKNILNQFRDSEGNLDIDKITTTAQQVGQLYGQVSPLLSKFIKR